MILIVDDSATNQVLMEAILQEEGFETASAFGAIDAFRLIERRPPKLILLDLLMPEVDGYDFLRAVKESKIYSHIPILIVSAVANKKNIEECFALGATDFFSKPIHIPTFIEKIKQFTLK